MISFKVTRMLACENSHPSSLPARVAGEEKDLLAKSHLGREQRRTAVFAGYKDVTVDDVRQAVAEEMDGPGKLLGYRAMQKKNSTGA